jgi:Zn-dependent M28 family amino/carboxypeptidase
MFNILIKRYLLPSLFIPFFILLGCSFIQADTTSVIDHIQKQLSFGPRIPGSEASKLTANYFKEYLEVNGWKVEFQEFYFDDILLRNVVAKNSTDPPKLILGAHYDTRQYSDQDPIKSKQNIPVPGAIDGASGSALILELGKLISNEDTSIWLVFFDGEDQGRINNWEWSIGADYFAKNMAVIPEQVVILDMLGDANLKVYKELNSDLDLTEDIWKIAEGLGYANSFINVQKHSFIDDHLPFINLGIPTALLIDFDYPYWHTTSDTLDNVSENNLEIVLDVMLEWIRSI